MHRSRLHSGLPFQVQQLTKDIPLILESLRHSDVVEVQVSFPFLNFLLMLCSTDPRLAFIWSSTSTKCCHLLLFLYTYLVEGLLFSITFWLCKPTTFHVCYDTLTRLGFVD